MTEDTLWVREDHTEAKHQVLRRYLDGWIPKLGHQAVRVARQMQVLPKLLLVDGFAGPGRYAGGEPGSPLIMLEALLTHSAFPSLSGVQFYFLFIEQDQARYEHLLGELSQISPPANVSVHAEHGHFESSFGTLVDEISDAGKNLIPTFAFIDPFGYSSASMSLTGRLLDFPRTEALYFLPLSYIVRFVGRAGQENALTSLFDCDTWREAIPLSGDERREFLANLFEMQLHSQGQVKYTTSFQLRTRDGSDYRLFFASGHEAGLELMKDAMWKVDPVEGIRYVAQTDTGQEVLFTPDVDTRPLLAELRAYFGTREFHIREAEEVTLLHTPFLPQSHLKRKTLVPAENDAVIQVTRPEGVRRGTFPNGVTMHFVD